MKLQFRPYLLAETQQSLKLALSELSAARAEITQLRERLALADSELERSRAQVEFSRRAVERMVDNALFAAGSTPVYEPEAERFRRRTADEIDKIAEQSLMTDPAEVRRKREQAVDQMAIDLEQRRFKSDLAAMADRRRTELENAQLTMWGTLYHGQT